MGSIRKKHATLYMRALIFKRSSLRNISGGIPPSPMRRTLCLLSGGLIRLSGRASGIANVARLRWRCMHNVREASGEDYFGSSRGESGSVSRNADCRDCAPAECLRFLIGRKKANRCRLFSVESLHRPKARGRAPFSTTSGFTWDDTMRFRVASE